MLLTIRNNILKKFTLFLIGGFLYYGLEMLWRGRSHPAMILVGGTCFLLCGFIHAYFAQYPLLVQGCISAVWITLIELLSGFILNIWLGLGIWDYSTLPFNLKGQICPLFSFFWIIMAIFAILIYHHLQRLLFVDNEPL